MNVLPGQKLTISQFFLGLAAGLMFFLLPNDAKNQIGAEGLCEAYIFLITLVITGVLFFITKRYEAVGVAMFAMSCLMAASLLFDIIVGIIESSSSYWPDINQYKIVSMFLLWFIPFVVCMVFRLLSTGKNDNNESRRGFASFMSLSMRALLVMYVIVIIFKLIMPERPSQDERETDLMILSRITQCLNGTHENGIAYIMWHCIVLAPLSFYLSVLVPKLKVWQIVIIAACFGIATEVMQFIFNTATACTDDILMLIVGAVLGILFKKAIDKLRSVITKGEDLNMLSFEYAHLMVKPKGEAQVLTDE